MNINREYLRLLGERVREIRTEKNMTLKELAFRINKDYQSIQRLELGQVNPTIQYLREVATGLGLEVNELLDFHDNNQ